MPFLLPLLSLIAGILAANCIKVPSWGLIPVAIACISYLIILKKAATPVLALKYNKIHVIWIFFLFFGIGVFDMSFQKPAVYSEKEINSFVVAEGEIIETKSFASGDRFVVKIRRMADSLHQVKAFRNFQVLLSTDGLSAESGDIITFPANFFTLKDNPNLRPSGFAERMKRAGLTYGAIANEGQLHIKGYNDSFLNCAQTWRNRLIVKIEKSSLSRQACNFIVALLLGDRTFLSEEVRDTFSNAGIAHVLALSGMHVAIIMGIFLALLFPLKLVGLHNTRYILALIAIWTYTFFTGLAPSTVRACIMTTFVVAALMLQRRNKPENSLLAAAFIILVINPNSLFDIGLQLSFLCVGSLLLFAGPLNPISQRNHPKLHSLVSAVLVTLVATVTTWVVISFYFKSIPLLFLPVNLCLLPLLPFYIWGAFLYISLLISGIDFNFLSLLLSKGYEIFEWTSSHLSAFGHATISINVQLPVVVLWFLGIMIIAYGVKKRPRKSAQIIAGGVAMLGIAIICIPIFNKREPDGIIFQKDFREISLALYDGNKATVSKLPRNSVSRIYHKDCEILAVDCSRDVDSLATLLSSSRKRRRHYLILGSGIKSIRLNDVPGIKDFDKIILHSSIKRKMETAIRHEAAELGLNTLYSLREEGPLEELLPDSLPTIR